MFPRAFVALGGREELSGWPRFGSREDFGEVKVSGAGAAGGTGGTGGSHSTTLLQPVCPSGPSRLGEPTKRGVESKGTDAPVSPDHPSTVLPCSLPSRSCSRWQRWPRWLWLLSGTRDLEMGSRQGAPPLLGRARRWCLHQRVRGGGGCVLTSRPPRPSLGNRGLRCCWSEGWFRLRSQHPGATGRGWMVTPGVSCAAAKVKIHRKPR